MSDWSLRSRQRNFNSDEQTGEEQETQVTNFAENGNEKTEMQGNVFQVQESNGFQPGQTDEDEGTGEQANATLQSGESVERPVGSSDENATLLRVMWEAMQASEKKAEELRKLDLEEKEGNRREIEQEKLERRKEREEDIARMEGLREDIIKK
jgi:hypothetical protein